jgi:hypothetical protein
MYGKFLAGLVVVALIASAVYWHESKLSEAYEKGETAGRDAIQADLAKAQAEIIDLRAKSEIEIVKDRIVYRDRIQKIREVVTDCTLPDELTRLLRESGVFSR